MRERSDTAFSNTKFFIPFFNLGNFPWHQIFNTIFPTWKNFSTSIFLCSYLDLENCLPIPNFLQYFSNLIFEVKKKIVLKIWYRRKCFKSEKRYKKLFTRKNFPSRKNSIKNLVSKKISRFEKSILEVWCRKKISKSER